MFFINPLFLFAATAGVVPVIIHFMFRKRAKTVFFPSIVFLRQLDKEVIKRRRLQEILIMLLRILVLVLFAMFLAKPILKADLFFGKSAKSVVIIIDDSYSMQAVDDKPVFEKARERAISIIKGLGPGDKAAIVMTSGLQIENAEAVSLSSDLASLHQKVERLQAGFKSANLSLAFDRSKQLLEVDRAGNSLIFLITDMQRKDWLDIERKGKEKKIPLVIVDVGPESPLPNVAITGVEVSSRPDDIARKIFTFKIMLHNYSPENSEITLGMYTSSDKFVDDTLVALKAGEEKSVRLVFQPGEAGWQGGYFRIQDDRLAVDNTRYYAIRMREEVRIGIFIDALISTAGYDKYFFLSRAIDPLEQDYPFSVERFSKISREELSKYDVTVFPLIPELDETSFTHLNNHIRDGGKALFFADKASSKSRLSDLCIPGSDIGDFEKGIYKVGKETFGLSELFLDVDIYDRIAVSIPESSSSYSLAAFQDGKAFVIERLHGNGGMLLVTTGFDIEMTNLPFRHASVPLLYNLLFRLVGESRAEQHLCGDMLRIQPEWNAVITPDGTTSEIESGQSEMALERPGIYVARQEKKKSDISAAIAAANVYAEEGDLARIGPDEFGPLVPFSRWDRISSDSDIIKRMQQYSHGTPLWDYFLYAAMICFFAELFMANRAGRRV